MRASVRRAYAKCHGLKINFMRYKQLVECHLFGASQGWLWDIKCPNTNGEAKVGKGFHQIDLEL